MQRIMGLDVGSHTVGVAVSDPLGWTAQGLETIRINEDQKYFGYDRVIELVDHYQVAKIVIGLPKNMDNSLGPRAQASMTYGGHLQKLMPDLVIDYEDERLTTVQAERFLVEQADSSRKKRKQVIDKLAAVIILQNYLDRQ